MVKILICELSIFDYLELITFKHFEGVCISKLHEIFTLYPPLCVSVETIYS